MHKCIKKISKVLALTTMVSSFTFLPGFKVMGVNKNNPRIVNKNNPRILTTRAVADDLDRLHALLGADALFVGDDFLRNAAMAHRILQQLNALFGSNQEFTREYAEYLRRERKRLGILLFNDMEQHIMELLRAQAGFTPNQHGAITVKDTVMLFNCSDARAEAQTIGAFLAIRTYFDTPHPDEPIGLAL